uniref:Ovule protein n=1 Tax=Syphacia muris TaxID=451379 RepID=A0A0N5A9H0_9BILA
MRTIREHVRDAIKEKETPQKPRLKTDKPKKEVNTKESEEANNGQVAKDPTEDGVIKLLTTSEDDTASEEVNSTRRTSSTTDLKEAPNTNGNSKTASLVQKL